MEMKLWVWLLTLLVHTFYITCQVTECREGIDDPTGDWLLAQLECGLAPEFLHINNTISSVKSCPYYCAYHDVNHVKDYMYGAIDNAGFCYCTDTQTPLAANADLCASMTNESTPVLLYTSTSYVIANISVGGPTFGAVGSPISLSFTLGRGSSGTNINYQVQSYDGGVVYSPWGTLSTASVTLSEAGHYVLAVLVKSDESAEVTHHFRLTAVESEIRAVIQTLSLPVVFLINEASTFSFKMFSFGTTAVSLTYGYTTESAIGSPVELNMSSVSLHSAYRGIDMSTLTSIGETLPSTYLFVDQILMQEGYLVGAHVNVVRVGIFKVVIYRPVCTSDPFCIATWTCSTTSTCSTYQPSLMCPQAPSSTDHDYRCPVYDARDYNAVSYELIAEFYAQSETTGLVYIPINGYAFKAKVGDIVGLVIYSSELQAAKSTDHADKNTVRYSVDSAPLTISTTYSHESIIFKSHFACPAEYELEDTFNQEGTVTVSAALDNGVTTKTVTLDIPIQSAISDLVLSTPGGTPEIAPNAALAYNVAATGSDISYIWEFTLNGVSSGSYKGTSMETFECQDEGWLNVTVSARNLLGEQTASALLEVVAKIKNAVFLRDLSSGHVQVEQGKAEVFSLNITGGSRVTVKIDFGDANSDQTYITSTGGGSVVETLTHTYTSCLTGQLCYHVTNHVGPNITQCHEVIVICTIETPVINTIPLAADDNKVYMQAGKRLTIEIGLDHGSNVLYNCINNLTKEMQNVSQVNSLTPLPVFFYYQMNTIGNVTFLVNGSNPISSFNTTVHVVVTNCTIPKVIVTGSTQESSPTFFTMGQDAKIPVTKESSCYKFPCFYSWEILKKTGDTYDSHETTVENLTLANLVRKPGSLPSGVYKVDLKQRCTGNPPLTVVQSAYVTLIESALVCEIVGGSVISKPLKIRKLDDKVYYNITIDARASRDPDDPLRDISALTLQWRCRRLSNDTMTMASYHARQNDASDASIGDTCFNTNWRSIHPSNATFDQIGLITFNSSSFLLDIQYEFELTITKGSRTSSFSQKITFLSDLPPVKAVCTSNCNNAVNFQQSTILDTSCPLCGRSVFQCEMFLYYENMTLHPDNKNEAISSSGWNSCGFSIIGGKLEPSTTYVCLVQAWFAGATARSESTLQFTTASKPTGITCYMDPLEGITMNDKFKMSFRGATSPDQPLSFGAEYKKIKDGDSEVITNPNIVKWYSGPERDTPLYHLSAGTFQFTGYVLSSVGVRTDCASVDVIVSKDPEGAPNVEAMLASKPDPTDTGAMAAFVQGVSSAVEPPPLAANTTVVPELEAQNQAIGAPPEDEEKAAAEMEQKQDLLKSAIAGLAETEVKTMAEFSAVTNAYGAVTSDPELINEEAQELAVAGVSNACSQLEAMASSGDYGAEDIVAAVNDAKDAISNMMKATAESARLAKANLNSTDEGEPEASPELEDLQEQANQLLNAVDNLGKALKVPTGQTVTIQSESFELEVTKMNSQDLANLTLNSSGAEYGLPDDLGIADGSATCATTTMSEDVYLTDPANSDQMGSPTCSLDIRDENGDPIRVHDLEEPIRLCIANDASKMKPRIVNMTYPGEMTIERIAIKDPNRPILIRIELLNDYNADLIVYFRYNKAPSFTEWDFKFEVTPTYSTMSQQAISESSNIPHDTVYRMLSSNEMMIVDFDQLPNAFSPDVLNGTRNNTLYAGATYNGSTPGNILVDNIFTDDIEESENAVNCSITTYSPQCLYWDKTTNKWSSEGLSMGYNETDFNKTVCYTNHLTAFGGFQVKPEPIPTLSLDMLKNGFVLLLTVLIILLLYLIALIYTRRSDKQDTDKVGVCPLSDNNPAHRFSYEITVFTGMRRNAGTKSNIFFVCGGEFGESKIRHLEDPKRRTFAKNSSDSFVFTNETNLGDLTHLRIWHDNSGGGWYLRNVTITDLQRDKKFNFLCSRWLAVGEDDGQVERFLPVSSPEDLADFSYVFATKARQDLTDAHLWFSIYARPPCSSFTRTQRLSCCLSLLMTTMVASAMFYRVMPKPTPATENDVNGIKFTWAQVYVSIITSLITVPVNVLIITIFRMARPKANPEDKSPTPSTGAQSNPSDDVVNQDYIEVSVDQEGEVKAEKKKKKQPTTLPHWTIYIAWVLVFVSVMSSSVMVVIYGMVFGNKTSLDWLSSLMFSFSSDVMVTQPIKVFLLAIFVAAVLKKIDDVYSVTMGDRGKQLASDEQWLHGSADPNKVGVDLEISQVKPPNAAKLAMMRELRLKEKKMYSITREILVYSFFVFISLSVSYSIREEVAYWQTADLNELFQLKNKDPSNEDNTNFEKVLSYNEVWPFLDQYLIDIVFPLPWYNATGLTQQAATFPGRLYIGDINSKLVNGVRLRQIRLKPDTCSKTYYGANVTAEIDCAGDYSFLDEQKGEFYYTWTKPHNFSDPVSRRDSAWRYQDWAALDGYPFWGTLKTYFGGGYAVELFPKFPNRNIMENLKRLRWLDRHSRALFVEFSVFNAATNHFSMVTMLFEFPPTGGVVHYSSVLTFKLYRATAGFVVFTIFCEVLFIFFIIYFTYREGKLLRKEGMAYFKGFWNVIEIAIVVLAYMAVGFYIFRTYLASQLLDKLPTKKPDRFINFQFASYWDSVFVIVVALIVFFVSIKFMKLLRFNRRVSMLQSTLAYALPPLAMFSFIMFIVIFGTCLFSNIVFGSHLEGYSDLFKTTASQMSLLLGKFSYVEYEQTNRILGPIFFLLFNIIINWILVNMLISVVNDSFEVVCNNLKEQSNEYEMVDFIMDKFKGFVGVGTRRQEEVIEDINWKKKEPIMFDSSLTEDGQSTTDEMYPPDVISEKHAERWKIAEMSSLATDDFLKETEIESMIENLNACIASLGLKEENMEATKE